MFLRFGVGLVFSGRLRDICCTSAVRGKLASDGRPFSLLLLHRMVERFHHSVRRLELLVASRFIFIYLGGDEGIDYFMFDVSPAKLLYSYSVFMSVENFVHDSTRNPPTRLRVCPPPSSRHWLMWPGNMANSVSVFAPSMQLSVGMTTKTEFWHHKNSCPSNTLRRTPNIHNHV